MPIADNHVSDSSLFPDYSPLSGEYFYSGELNCNYFASSWMTGGLLE